MFHSELNELQYVLSVFGTKMGHLKVYKQVKHPLFFIDFFAKHIFNENRRVLKESFERSMPRITSMDVFRESASAGSYMKDHRSCQAKVSFSKVLN